MPLDVLGCTCATVVAPAGRAVERERRSLHVRGRSSCELGRELGMPRSHGSASRADYVPALCTHRPSLPSVDGTARTPEWLAIQSQCRDVVRTALPREGKSRNKVTVGEPSVGSRPVEKEKNAKTSFNAWRCRRRLRLRRAPILNG